MKDRALPRKQKKKVEIPRKPLIRAEPCVWAGTVTRFNLGRRIGAKFETFGAKVEVIKHLDAGVNDLLGLAAANVDVFRSDV